MIPLTLHIGTPKTATTSIQESLWLNHARLAESNIVFCQNLGQTNNIDLFLACLHHNEGGFGILENRKISGESARSEFRLDVTQRLRKLASQPSSQSRQMRLISSSEHFWFLWSPVHFQFLKSILHDSGVYLDQVVVYFRSQSDLLYSALSTMVRDGLCLNDIDVNSLGSHELKYLDYHSRLLAWKQFFPSARIQPFLFNDHKHNILRHFYEVCACPSDNLLVSPVMNESLSDTGIAILAELNRRFLTGKSRSEIVQYLAEENPRTALGRLVEKHCSGRPKPIPVTVAAINSFFEESNQQLLKEFFHGRQLHDLCKTRDVSEVCENPNAHAKAASTFVNILLDALSHSGA
jgi:hypothetical protein